MGHHLSWHIYCLKMMAVFLALKHFLPDLRGRYVLVRPDNKLVVSYVNHQGDLQLCPAHQIVLWSQGKLLSLKAVYIPRYQHQGADILLSQGLRSGEWRLHAETV